LTKKELASTKTAANSLAKMQQYRPLTAPTPKQIEYLLTLKRRLDPALKAQHDFDKLTRESVNAMTRTQVSRVIDTMLRIVQSQSPQSAKARKEALDAYHKACKQEAAHLSSIYSTSESIALLESRVKDAYARCVALGLDKDHGL
jgi:hypothetical protein